MSRNHENDWNQPNTEMIKRVRLPEYGNLSLEELQQSFGDLEAAMRQNARDLVAKQRGDKLVNLAQFLAAQNGDQVNARNDGSGAPYIGHSPARQQPYAPVSPVEAYDDEMLSTQGVPILFGSNEARRAYEATKQRREHADDSGDVSSMPGARRYDIGANGEFIPIVDRAPVSELSTTTVPGEKKNSRRLTRKGALRLGAAGVALMAGSAVVWQAGVLGLGAQGDAQASIAGEAHIDTSSTLPLSQVESKLLESYDACFDESGRGAPVVKADVGAVVPTTWSYTDAAGKLLSLGAIVGGRQVKPVVKLMPMQDSEAGAAVGVSACVVEADQEAAIVTDDASRTVTVDLAKITPQLQEGVYGSLAGFLRKDEDTAVIKTDAVIDQLLANKSIVEAEAARLKGAYADEANKKAERDQAVRKTSETIAKDGGVYANRLKASLGARVVALVHAQLDILRQQGMISEEPVEVKTVNAPGVIAITGAEPAKADAFSLADPARIVSFNVEAENK